MNGILQVPEPINEPVLSYAPGSAERKKLEAALNQLCQQDQSNPKFLDIPVIIGKERVRTGDTAPCLMPHDHEHQLATYHKAGKTEMEDAIHEALKAWETWSCLPWQARAAIFLRAAELLAGPFRQLINAAIMLDMSKNIYQAEIDTVELIDFWRFNAWFMQQIYQEQPRSSLGQWNQADYRPLEGFILAITPFNFLSIAGNLPTAPVMMGNVVVWKPASQAVFSAYHLMKIFQEAGLPNGVINFVPGPGNIICPLALNEATLAGVHFTGSTNTFQAIWGIVGKNVEQNRYSNYPRLVGETGGKDFIFAHSSADLIRLVVAIIRGAFEYQGQKCSAASRGYIPASLWPRLEEKLLHNITLIRAGDVRDFSCLVNAVIDETAYRRVMEAILWAKNSPKTRIICGGEGDDSHGYFIEPTLIVTDDPQCQLMTEEIFGPVFTVHVYPDDKYEETLRLCDETSPYALTGSIFATDRQAIKTALEILRHAAGNIYINDKPTGAVVGQQWFGGGRASGTNDKAGGPYHLLRWTSPRIIKETFNPPIDWQYPFMAPE